MTKVLIALSGGVDSAAAACLLSDQGYGCAGAMMRLFHENHGVPDGVADARAVADALDMPFYLLDFADAFQQEVINRFAEAYQSGLTPNPCIQCNRRIKFGLLLQYARALGMDAIATGHYARVEHGGAGQRHLLKKGADASKDQSYVLYTLTQEQLAHTILPLGELTKSQARTLVEARGPVNARKAESQDICFVPDGDYAGFILRHTGTDSPPGRFVDVEGRDLGEHRGLIHYTVGQRRGLGLPSGNRLYVKELRQSDNTVVVCGSDELFGAVVFANNVNVIPFTHIDKPLRLKAKLRYRHPEQPATVWPLDEDTLRIQFDSPQRAITPGQAAVLYDGDIVVGGGTIQRVES